MAHIEKYKIKVINLKHCYLYGKIFLIVIIKSDKFQYEYKKLYFMYIKKIVMLLKLFNKIQFYIILNCKQYC